MKRLSKCAVLLMLAGGTLCGTSCSTDLRDAFVAGVLDYVTDTTTDLLTVWSPIDDFAAQD